MNLKARKENLLKLYERFESEAAEFKRAAVCQPGCAFCCTTVGNVDITTLEGIIIRERVNSLPGRKKARIRKRLSQNIQDKKKSQIAPCPLLKDDNTCMIYDIRPFSCRQLYSLEKCGSQGPTIHRQVKELAQAAIKDIRKLDDTGYSGHISFILSLLNQADFRQFYLSGGFDPARIMAFGKKHGLVINRFITQKASNL